jgi:T5SS/PEP-CTERM-associated repeat protein
MKLITIGATGSALLWGGQWREAQATIILTSREGSVGVVGSVRGGAPGTSLPEANGYNVDVRAPQGLGGFSLSASPPAGRTTIDGASAVANGQVNGAITLGVDTLFVSSAGSVSESVSASRTATRETRGQANAGAGLNLNFTIDRPYDYVITFTTGLLGETLTDPLERANATFGILTTFGFRRDRCFQGVCDFDEGPLIGTLQPGSYFLASSVSVQGLKRDGSSSASANYQFTLELLKPFVRWKNATSGIYQTGGNWDSGAPPTGTDNARIDRPGTYTVTLAGNAAHRRLDVGGNGANVTLDFDGHRYRLDELHLGDPSGNFSFTLSDSSGIIAVPPGDSGPWPAPGTGEGEITNLTTDGPGRTDITAKTESQNGLIDHSHVVTVQGDGDWQVNRLTVGDQRPATLLVSGGGKVNSSFPIIGKQVRGLFSAPGKVSVSGGGGLTSKFEAVEMVVGDDGKGELVVNAGGEVTAADIRVGNISNGDGRVTVDGLTASLRQNHSDGDLMIGAEGKGTLNVLNDGQVVANGAFFIGASTGANSEGNVNVTREGFVVAKSLTVGNGGKGTLSVLAEGLAQSKRMLIGPRGIVTIGDDGNLSVDNVLTVNGELSVNTTGAALVGPTLGATVGKLTIAPGGTLKGNGTIRADVDFAGGIPQFTGSRLAPANSTGTLTIEGDVVQATGSALEIEIGGTAAGQFDLLKVTGDATLGGDVFLKFTDGFAPRQGQQFEFLDVSGTLAGAFTNVHLRNLAPGFQFDLRPDGGGMTMVALNDGEFRLPTSTAWNEDRSGNWASVANWTDGEANHAGVTAVLGGKITAPRTITVDEPITVRRIDFENANAYTIDGDEMLTLDATSGAAQINVTSGSHTISAPVSLADNTMFTVAPANSNLSLTRALSAGAANVAKAGAGRLTLASFQAGGLTIDQGTLALAPGSTDAGTSVISSLSIAGGTTPTAKVDLNDNAAIVNYAGTSPAATVRAQILAGRGGAGLGANWSGQGITSSAAATANATDAESRSVGFAENATMPLGALTTFRGRPVDDTSILMAFTRTGDANLDGAVNDDDVTIVGATYAPSVSQPLWALGDFDYNGFVDDDDVTLLGAFYDPSAAPLIGPPAEPGANASARGVAAVPEPGSLLLLVVGLGGFAVLYRGRRIRRSR